MKLTIPKNEFINDDNINAEATDFAKALGVGTLIQDNYYGGYVIDDYNSNKRVTSVYNNALKVSFNPKNRFIGIRLAVDFSDISRYCSNFRINKDGHICQVDCFMYPKNVTSKDIRALETMRKLYTIEPNNSHLNMANSITIDSYPIDSTYPFFPKTMEQYIYNGKIYIRVLSNILDKVILSNNKTYDNSEYIWFETSPILWDVDQKRNIAISHDIIVGGIPFDVRNKYKGNFEKTTMNSYLNNYLKKDLINSIPYSKGGKTYHKTRF